MKRFLTSLLCLIMVFTMMPVIQGEASKANAGDTEYVATITKGETTTPYETLGAAVKAAKKVETTIVLVADSTENITIVKGQIINLDLNNHVLSGGGSGRVITNNGTLSIKDSVDSENRTVRYFTDEDSDGCFEKLEDTTYDINGKIEGTDYVAVSGGVIAGGAANRTGTKTGKGGGIYSTRKLTLDGINVVGNIAENGGGIWVASDTNISNTSIIGNRATSNVVKAYGGGLYTDKKASLSLESVNVAYNIAESSSGSDCSMGGGLCLYNSNAEVTTISNCKIDYNKSVGNDRSTIGAGIAIANANVVISGTTISNNHAIVYQDTPVTSEKNAFGGGIYVGSNAIVKIDDINVEISNNIAQSPSKAQGGAVYNAKIFEMTNGTIVDNAVISGRLINAKGGGICNVKGTSTLKLGGSVQITGNYAKEIASEDQYDNNVYLRYDGTDTAKIILSDPHTDMVIGVHGDDESEYPVCVTTHSDIDTYKSCFTSDETQKFVLETSGEELRLSHLHGDIRANMIPREDIQLTEDLTVNEGETFVICLNGHNLDLNKHHIINNGTLIICDCEKKGVIKNGEAEKGAAIYNTGILDISDITIQDCNASYAGGAIFNYHGAVSLTHATLSNCTAGSYGGAIYSSEYEEQGDEVSPANITLNEGTVIDGCTATTYFGGGIFNRGELVMNAGATIKNCTAEKGAGIHNHGAYYVTFTMNGGVIKNNTAAQNGGGVQNSEGATFNLYGGSITENNATGSFGGGVFNKGTLNIEEKSAVVVSGNTTGSETKTDSNIANAAASGINLIGELTSNSTIGLSGIVKDGVYKLDKTLVKVVGASIKDTTGFFGDNGLAIVKFRDYLEAADVVEIDSEEDLKAAQNSLQSGSDDNRIVWNITGNFVISEKAYSIQKKGINLMINGNNHTITASNITAGAYYPYAFNFGSNRSNYTAVIINDLNLVVGDGYRNGIQVQREETAGRRMNLTLNNVDITMSHISIPKDGPEDKYCAPIVINDSDVTLKGECTITTDFACWSAIDLTSRYDGHDANLYIDDASTTVVEFVDNRGAVKKASEPLVKMTVETEGESVTVSNYTKANLVPVEVDSKVVGYNLPVTSVGNDDENIVKPEVKEKATEVANDIAEELATLASSFNGTGVSNAESQSISEVLGGSGYVDVQLVSVGFEAKAEDADTTTNITKFTFDVTPYDSNHEEQHQLASAVTFRLPIVVTGFKFANVSHGTQFIKQVNITGKNYIELSSDRFSEYSYELTNTVISSGFIGGGFVSIQKPTITTDNGATAELSIDGVKATITVKEGYELVDVTVNGESKGAVNALTGLKTGDKVVVTTKKIANQEFSQQEVKSVISNLLIRANTKYVKKNGKKYIQAYATVLEGSEELQGLLDNGYTVKYVFYRGTQKKAGALNKVYTTSKNKYTNTKGKNGTRYYYRAVLKVYDTTGTLVASTKLSQCKYGARVFNTKAK